MNFIVLLRKSGAWHWLAAIFLLSGAQMMAQPGTLDATFDGDGIAQTLVSPLGLSGNINDLEVYADGRTLTVGGSFVSGSDSRTTLVRYNADGSLDTAFGTGGIVHLNSNFFPPNVEETGFAVTVNQMNGKIAVLSEVIVTTSPVLSSDLIVYQLNADGTLDTGFSGDGAETINFSGTSNEEAGDILFRADGAVLVLGTTSGGGDSSGFMKQFLADGTPDFDFGGRFTAIADIAPPNLTDGTARNTARKLALQNDGKFYVVGSGAFAGSSNLVAFIGRFDSAGLIDPTFTVNDGGGGYSVLDVPGSVSEEFYGVAISNLDNAVYAAGSADDFNQALVARFTMNGALDPVFSGDGIVTFNGTNFTSGQNIAVTPNTKVVLNLGKVDGNFHVLSLLPSGAVDPTIGVNGEMTVSPTSDAGDFDRSLTIGVNPVDGKIYAAGESYTFADDTSRFSIVRLLPPDATTATAAISGRISNAAGRKLRGVTVTLTDPTTGATRRVLSNSFGLYRFADLTVNSLYVVSVASKRHAFAQSTQALQISGNTENINFVAE